MIIWYLALAFVLAFCCTSGARMRTWSALGIGSLVGWFLPQANLGELATVAVFIAVDALAAAIVLRSPAGLAQKIVGVGFAGMIICHGAYVISPRTNWEGYAGVLTFVGWAQLLCLWAWGAWDGVATWRREPFHSRADNSARAR